MRDDHRVQRHPDVEILELIFKSVERDLATPCPEFASWSWLHLSLDDPARTAAAVKAALVWWADSAFGETEQRQLAAAGEAVHGADPALWTRVAADRAQRVPVGRQRSLYGPLTRRRGVA